MPLIGLTFLTIQISAVKQETYENLESVHKLKIGQIESWLNERQGNCISIKNSVGLALSVQSLFQHKNDTLYQPILTKLFESLQTTYGYESVFLADTTGKVLLSTGNNTTVSKVVQTLLAQLITNKEIVNTDLYREENGGCYLKLIGSKHWRRCGLLLFGS